MGMDFDTRIRRIVASVWVFIAIHQFSFDLTRPLGEWDEQIYFNVARNVLRGHWLLPWFTLESHPLSVVKPFLHKPPLVYWIHATAMAIGGVSPEVARWPSVLAMAGVVGLCVLLAWRLSGVLAGILAGGLAIPMSAMTYTRAAIGVATDPFLLLFGTAGIYALVVAIESSERRWWVLAGIGYGLAILSKGVAAAPFGVFVLPYLAYKRPAWNWRQFRTMVAAGVIVTLPWFVAVLVLAPSELISQMFESQVIGRATGETVATESGTFGFMKSSYFRDAPEYFAPTGYILITSAAMTIVQYARSRRFTAVEILCWPLAIGTFVLYVFVGNHTWYILPVAVPVAVLAADTVARALVSILDVLVTTVVIRSGWWEADFLN